MTYLLLSTVLVFNINTTSTLLVFCQSIYVIYSLSVYFTASPHSLVLRIFQKTGLGKRVSEVSVSWRRQRRAVRRLGNDRWVRTIAIQCFHHVEAGHLAIAQCSGNGLVQAPYPLGLQTFRYRFSKIAFTTSHRNVNVSREL